MGVSDAILLAATGGDPQGVWFIGLAPDGTRAISMTLPDGAIVHPRPRDDIYAVREPSARTFLPFRSLTITLRTGRTYTWCRSCRASEPPR